MSATDYDLIVVGGGIYGACILRDAALRGISCVLLERREFGSATSHNSNKIIHSGIRYLQQLDIPRVVECVRETRNWMRIAPHLVTPLPFVVPSYGLELKGKELIALGVKGHDLIKRMLGCDLPGGGMLSRAETLRRFPMIEPSGLRGAAYWYDGQLQNANQLIEECIEDARQHGAEAHSYTAVEATTETKGRIDGVLTRKLGAEATVPMRGKLVVNAAGPWLADVLPPALRRRHAFDRHYMGMNLVVDQVSDQAGLAMYGPGQESEAKQRRLYFLTPWKDRSIIGTSHVFRAGSPDDVDYSEQSLSELIRGASEAFPFLGLERDKVHYVYQGLTPAAGDRESLTRSRQFSIVDHERRDGIRGLISVMGVKLTSARYIAERVLDLAEAKLGRRTRSLTAEHPLPGAAAPLPGKGQRESLQQLLSRADKGRTLTLTDLITCRTELAERGVLGTKDLEACADAMAKSLSWSPARRESELAAACERLRLQTSKQGVRV